MCANISVTVYVTMDNTVCRAILDPLWATSRHDYQMWEKEDIFKSWDDPRLMQFGINWKYV